MPRHVDKCSLHFLRFQRYVYFDDAVLKQCLRFTSSLCSCRNRRRKSGYTILKTFLSSPASYLHFSRCTAFRRADAPLFSRMSISFRFPLKNKITSQSNGGVIRSSFNDLSTRETRVYLYLFLIGLPLSVRGIARDILSSVSLFQYLKL